MDIKQTTYHYHCRGCGNVYALASPRKQVCPGCARHALNRVGKTVLKCSGLVVSFGTVTVPAPALTGTRRADL